MTIKILGIGKKKDAVDKNVRFYPLYSNIKRKYTKGILVADIDENGLRRPSSNPISFDEIFLLNKRRTLA